MPISEYINYSTLKLINGFASDKEQGKYLLAPPKSNKSPNLVTLPLDNKKPLKNDYYESKSERRLLLMNISTLRFIRSLSYQNNVFVQKHDELLQIQKNN